MVILLLFNTVIVIVALVGLNMDCVGACWNGYKLGDSDDIQFISKHFMQCKYAASTLERVWPWVILFLALFLFAQWFFSIELLLMVHLHEMLEMLHVQKKTNSIESQIFMTEVAGSNTLLRFISRAAYILSCVGLLLVVFFDMSSFPPYETCVSATHQKQFADWKPQTWHFVGFSLLFAGIGLQHFSAAAIYYYMVLPTEDGTKYRAYYIGIDGIFVLLFAVFVILYTIIIDIQASIYTEYFLVLSVSCLSLFNVVVCCRMLHRIENFS